MANIIISKKRSKGIGRNISPTSYMQSIQLSLPKNDKKKKNIKDIEFSIPSYGEYNHIFELIDKVPHLNQISKHYKQKQTGNKDELRTRIYNYLYFSCHCIKIQNIWRKHILNLYNQLRGPARFKRNICINETDFFSMDKLREIPYHQFISFYDENDRKIYGFDILSLYNLYSKGGKTKPDNPYNRNTLSKTIKKKLNLILKLGNMFGDKINIKIDDNSSLSDEKQLELQALTLFQNIDALGNYTNSQWFMVLNRTNVIRYIRELYDIWNYRANLSELTKREICPPVGNPFRHINLHNLPTLSLQQVRMKSLDIMNYMVNRGVNEPSKTLGATYVLCALTLVNYEAAQNLPWLYQSVAPL